MEYVPMSCTSTPPDSVPPTPPGSILSKLLGSILSKPPGSILFNPEAYSSQLYPDIVNGLDAEAIISTSLSGIISTLLDSIISKTGVYSFSQLSPDIVNGLDAGASSNGISPVEPKLPINEVTRRVDSLHVALTLDRNSYNSLDRNNNSASNKASGGNDYRNNSDNDDEDDNDNEDGDNDNNDSTSEYSLSVEASGKQEKRHLDNNTDDKNKQSPRKYCKHTQSLARNRLYHCDRGSHSPPSIKPSVSTRENTPIKTLPSLTVSNSATVIYEECSFSDGTILKRTIIDR